MSLTQRFRAAAGRIPCGTLLLAAAAIGLQFRPAMCGWLQYDRFAIGDGEWWRILTCHLTHVSVDHLLWDVGMLLCLGWLSEPDDRRRWGTCVALSAIAIPAALWWLLPDLQTYRGLSGIDSALFVLVAFTVLRRSLREESRTSALAATLLLIGFVAKTCYELLIGATLFVDSATAGMTPIPLAHVVGAAVGFAAGVAGRRIHRCGWSAAWRSCRGDNPALHNNSGHKQSPLNWCDHQQSSGGRIASEAAHHSARFTTEYTETTEKNQELNAFTQCTPCTPCTPW